MDEATAEAIRAKANSHFNGNISACIRCATLQYDGEVTPLPATSEITALLTAILRQLKKIGTNVNQTARQINERMKRVSLRIVRLGYTAVCFLPQ